MCTMVEPGHSIRARTVAMQIVLVSIAMSASYSDAAAQVTSRGAELWGHVIAIGDSVGVLGATVDVAPGRSTTTSQTGFYRLASLSAGPHLLTVRRLGYRSVTVEVNLQDADALRQDVMLEGVPQQLTEVRIEGRLRKVPPRFEDVYRRMTTAWGSFFTREDIDRLNPPDIASLLERVGTVHVNMDGIQAAKCNGGGNLVLSPGGGKVQIYIDGLRMTGRTQKFLDQQQVALEQREVLRMVNPSQIQAIEVYSGVSRIPGQFLEDACAVVAIWTKSY
jgi:Carboxypeptidase regulatory-like domain/TonB-dependent Receptor Plug Domain